MTVVTRFAPSPTGYLHIGGARTALFSWLYARKNGGKFVLRIEDTDRERSTEAAVQAIFEGLEWLGLGGDDEKPIFQTQRFDRYREVAKQLLDQGHAYRCYCTKQELDDMRSEQKARKQKPRYDGRCRERSDAPDQPFVLRFKNPQDGITVVPDLIKGDVQFHNSELDDLIIARTDGTPTYNFCVVVDDLDMGITHVIRGDDHVNNTPRQLNIFKALATKPPQFAHVPMILGPDGVKMSKRHGAVSVIEYRALGFLPEPMINYLARLGWSHGDQELFTREELIKAFDITKVQKAAARFDMDKLVWVNHEYLKKAEPATVESDLRWHLDRIGVTVSDAPALGDVFLSQRERCKTLVEMAEKSRFFYEAPAEYKAKDAKKHFTADAADLLEALMADLKAVTDWKAEPIHAAVHALAEGKGVGLGAIAQPIRVAIAGMAISPPIDQTLALLGRETSLDRLGKAVSHIRSQS